MPSSRRVFYGWYVVAAALVILTMASGLAFYNLSILLAAFVAERGFPVALASTATALFFFAAGIGGIVAGRLIDRIDARLVIASGACVGAAALASVGLLSELWQLFAFHIVLGAAHGASSLVPVTTVIARWFNVRRSLAFSIGSTGLSLGGILVAPVVALSIERYGLSAAAPWMAIALFLGIVPVTLLVLRASPQAMGLEPDGLSRTEVAASPPQPSTPYRTARRSGYFLAVSAAYTFLLGAQVGAIAHFYRLVSTRHDAATAALALAVLATGSTVGRLVGGGLLLRVPAHTFALVLMVMQACGLAILAVAESRLGILAATTLFAVTIGNSLMMHPLLLAERFGTRDYGRIYATSQMVTILGVAGCPALVGLLYEMNNGYQLPFLVISALTLIGFAILAAFGSPRAPIRAMDP
ncbi:MAG: MFS transporter [Hyphomonadaceae bacterium]|jgi:MFS family permease|nr:MFS transporter [Hyphomonadaceae bacterium]